MTVWFFYHKNLSKVYVQCSVPEYSEYIEQSSVLACSSSLHLAVHLFGHECDDECNTAMLIFRAQQLNCATQGCEGRSAKCVILKASLALNNV